MSEVPDEPIPDALLSSTVMSSEEIGWTHQSDAHPAAGSTTTNLVTQPRDHAEVQQSKTHDPVRQPPIDEHELEAVRSTFQGYRVTVASEAPTGGDKLGGMRQSTDHTAVLSDTKPGKDTTVDEAEGPSLEQLKQHLECCSDEIISTMENREYLGASLVQLTADYVVRLRRLPRDEHIDSYPSDQLMILSDVLEFDAITGRILSAIYRVVKLVLKLLETGQQVVVHFEHKLGPVGTMNEDHDVVQEWKKFTTNIRDALHE